MIGWRVSILWGSKIALSHWQSQWPLTQGWRYRAACDIDILVNSCQWANVTNKSSALNMFHDNRMALDWLETANRANDISSSTDQGVCMINWLLHKRNTMFRFYETHSYHVTWTTTTYQTGDVFHDGLRHNSALHVDSVAEDKYFCDVLQSPTDKQCCSALATTHANVSMPSKYTHCQHFTTTQVCT